MIRVRFLAVVGAPLEAAHPYLVATIAALILFLALGAGTVYASSGAADPISWDEYWRRIDALAVSLDGAGQDPTVAAAAADELAAIEAVVLPDGQVLPVDNGDLVAILRRDDWGQDDLQAALARLAALQRARDLVVEHPSRATSQTFAQLDEILSRPEFASATSSPTAEPSLFQQLVRRLIRWWREHVGEPPGIEYLFTILGVAVVLAVLVYAFRGAWRQWVAEGQGRADGLADDEADLSSDEALARAQALSAGGDYRQAVRYLYLSTLLWLDERGLLRYDPALTNREFLRQVARDTGHAGLHEALAPLVDLFDRVWYGFAPLDSHGYVTYVRQVERLRQMDGAG